jgi:hypothetical protein
MIALQADVWRWEFDEWELWWVPVAKVPNSEISIAGKTPDCNGIVSFIMDNNSSSLDVTPEA